MKFTQITVFTTHDGIEPVTGRLYTLGINGVEIEDREDYDEFAAKLEPNWDKVDESVAKKFSGETKVKAYVADNASGYETLQSIKKSMAQLADFDKGHQFGSLKIALADSNEEDFAQCWKKYYKPTRIGKHVVIVPEWETFDPGTDDTVIRMNPGAAFGTGTHETTRLCIEFLEEFTEKSTKILDIGTGSGILAITALKLGAKSALGIDIDELSTKVALENAELNGVGGKLVTRIGDLTESVDDTYNIITANIVADVIIRLAPNILDHLAPNGIFIASGIINTRESEVREKLLQCGLCVFDSKNQKNWFALACRRK